MASLFDTQPHGTWSSEKGAQSGNDHTELTTPLPDSPAGAISPLKLPIDIADAVSMFTLPFNDEPTEMEEKDRRPNTSYSSSGQISESPPHYTSRLSSGTSQDGSSLRKVTSNSTTISPTSTEDALERLPTLLVPFHGMGGGRMTPNGNQRGRHRYGLSNVIAPKTMFQLGHLAADLAAFPGVAPAINTLELIYLSIAKVAYNQGKCRRLANKAKGVFDLIKDNAEADGTKLEKAINATNMHLKSIHSDVLRWSTYSWWKGWLYRDEIGSDIQAHEDSLKEVMEMVQFAAVLQIHAEVKRLQETLKVNAPGTKEHKTAEKELFDLRENKHALDLPSSLGCECVKVGTMPAVSGSTYDVWEGKWLGRIPVALKFNRSFRLELDKENSKKRFERQVDLWRRLDHKFVLTLHGWYMADDGDVFVVSPWMTNGNIKVYLEKKKPGPEDLLRLIYEIASGLKYLHEAQILHGGLRPSNVLIQEHGHAVVSDFSLSKMMAEDAVVTQGNAHTTAFRYQAPETDENKPMSAAGDIYSWAMTSLEIVSGRMPFPRYVSPTALLTAIFGKGETPQLTDHSCATFEKYPELWALLAQCWDPVKDQRPTLEHVLEQLGDLCKRAV